MRKILTLTLILGIAVLVGGLADANGATGVDASSATATGVRYDWWGSAGELSIVGEPGTTYAVYDSNGTAVAGGQLDASAVAFVVGNSGPGPNGVLVYVLVGNDVFATTDPNWEWN